MEQVLGIDAISVYVPRLYVDLTDEWCTVRAPQLGAESADQLRGKLVSGVGIRRMAVPDGHEDAATMAAMAAKRLIDQTGIDPADLETVAVGTETTVDQSKSMAAYVLGMLERHYQRPLRHVGTPQVQFACIGATYALEAALHQLRAGENSRPYAMVIATDIAKYRLRSPGEYTQGAGAVAMLIARNPRLLVIVPGVVGTATRDARDFFRPNWSATAVVDGKHSIDVYLACLEDALREHVARTARRRHWELEASTIARVLAEYDRFLFHVPFPRMAEYAAARTFRLMWTHAARAHGPLTALRASLPNPSDAREIERRMTKTDWFRDHFKQTVASSLELSSEIGNVYSASLYLCLASLVCSAARDGSDLSGLKVLFGSYGSGASAKVLAGTFAPRWREVVNCDYRAELRPASEGGLRVALSVDQYERLHSHRVVVRPTPVAGVDDRSDDEMVLVGPPPSIVAPENEFCLGRFGESWRPDLPDYGYRYYEYAAAKQESIA